MNTTASSRANHPVRAAEARIPNGDVTRWLNAWKDGDPKAVDELLATVMGELRRLARRTMARQPAWHTWQPTALVHEACLRLLGREPAGWEDRSHFLGYMATTMRRLVINHARDKVAQRRGGGAVHLALDEAREPAAPEPNTELLDLDRALGELETLDPRAAKVVELRFFAALSVEETADALGVSPRSVKRDWQAARLWLLDHLATR